jgi:glycosyltransferase involved in cell wall biosynthesis
VRVLHLLSCRGWASDAYWAARVCVELARQGHEVTLCCREGTDERVIERARREGVSRIETLAFSGGVDPRADARDVRRLAAWLSTVDVVHAHRGKEHWLAAMAKVVSGAPVPLVRTRHIVQAVRPHRGNRWLYRRTARIVTVSEAIRRQYLASGLLSPEQVTAIPGGADAGGYHPDIDAGVARPGGPIVGMIGGLRVMKGHRVLIAALSALRREGVRPRVAIVGRGAMEDVVRRAISREGLEEQCVLGGFVTDLPAAMAAIDVAVYVPLESDGMSRVLFEYLAAGRAVVASRVGVVPEVLTDDRDALLVPGGDPVPLALALKTLVADSALRARLGTAGRQLLVERYSGERVAARLAELYRAA